MSYVKVAIDQIKNELQEKKSLVSNRSLEWQKLHWMFYTIEYLSFAVDSLDDIGSKYRELYALPVDEAMQSQDFAYKKYKEIIYHARSFYESTYIYCSGLFSSDVALIQDSEFFSGTYSELVLVCKLRNLFIVHPTKIAATFRGGVRVYALPDDDIFLPSISSNHLYSEETRKKYLSAGGLGTQRLNFLNSLKSRIIKTGARPWDSLLNQLSEEEFEMMQMLGMPEIDQLQYANQIQALHSLAFSRITA